VTDLSAGADRCRDTPVTPSKDWRTRLDGCDFDMASLEIREMLDINQREAASRGEEVTVRNDLGGWPIQARFWLEWGSSPPLRILTAL
jgi:hypothetical protein